MAAILDPAALPPPPDPITVRQAIDDLLLMLSRIRRKLSTLIDWYIYPDVVPDEIKAYDPRLLILQSRLKSLSTLSYEQLPYIIDGSDNLAAHYLGLIVDQLISAVHGIQHIFINHYDRDLEERRPFFAIWETLAYRGEQCKQIPVLNPSNPRGLRAEDMRANELRNFCRGALQLSNGRDKGRISFVEKKDLLEENRRKLKAFGGAFLYWECPECSYKIRYHVANSATSNIHSTDEVRELDGLGVQYRSSFLAKCHLYLPLSDRTTSAAASSTVVKYGCVFCFATGWDLERGETAFATVREFVEHLAREHKSSPPTSLMLHRFFVAIEGKLGDVRKRWDLNLA